MAMYQGDKVTRVTLRLTEKQFAFVKKNADIMGVSPSEFLRMVVNMTMMQTERFATKLGEAENKIAAAAAAVTSEEGCGRE
ncbi:MAG: hypothetical protein IKZ44_07055, partial [Clostridia bacterium]|nr:hypothetical protein [Clostridia bacterium]